jgi:stage V sporulation protein SpoVS
MPRDGEIVRRRLQLAALELYQECGYEQTTAAAAFRDALTTAVRRISPELGPWDTLFLAFRSIEPIFVENRPFSEPRRRVIANSPALQERVLAKTSSVIAALASTLRERGVPERQANLAAQMGMATLSHAVAKWLDEDSTDLGDQIIRAFYEVRDLSSSSSKLGNDT